MTSSANISNCAAIHEMHGRGLDHPSDTWIVNMEATSALLIVFGSLLAFGCALGTLPHAGIVGWALDCLFPLQFPVFYFASGYLYQRYRSVRTRRAWVANVKREAVVLLVPFAVFTVLALLVSTLTASPRPFTLFNLFDALFINPVDPLGYFPTCFLLFLITPTVISRRNGRRLLAVALVCKVAVVALLSLPMCAPVARHVPFLIVSVAENWIWFAGGMGLSLLGALPLLRTPEKAWALGALWIAASVITFIAGWLGEASHGVLDAIGIVWFASLFSAAFRSGMQDTFYGLVSRYTMAFWLIGPVALKLIVAALTALGLTATGAPWLCLGAAVVAAFGAPVALMALLNRLGRAGFVVYPARYLAAPDPLIEKKGVS